MDSTTSCDPSVLPAATAHPVKVLIAGAFGVGKTSLIGAVSEIPPLATEETLTQAGIGVDHLGGQDKRTTTVALDFGRRTLAGTTVLYLFGVGGQERFRGLWPRLAIGAAGVLVLVDTRRLADAFAVLDHVEGLGLPIAIAVNAFPDAAAYSAEQIREALDLPAFVPVVECNALEAPSCIRALAALVQHAHTTWKP